MKFTYSASERSLFPYIYENFQIANAYMLVYQEVIILSYENVNFISFFTPNMDSTKICAFSSGVERLSFLAVAS